MWNVWSKWKRISWKQEIEFRRLIIYRIVGSSASLYGSIYTLFLNLRIFTMPTTTSPSASVSAAASVTESASLQLNMETLSQSSGVHVLGGSFFEGMEVGMSLNSPGDGGGFTATIISLPWIVIWCLD